MSKSKDIEALARQLLRSLENTGKGVNTVPDADNWDGQSKVVVEGTFNINAAAELLLEALSPLLDDARKKQREEQKSRFGV